MKHELKIDDLKNHEITFVMPLPKNHDGSFTFKIKDNKMIITFNSSFLDEYEEKLYSNK